MPSGRKAAELMNKIFKIQARLGSTQGPRHMQDQLGHQARLTTEIILSPTGSSPTPSPHSLCLQSHLFPEPKSWEISSSQVLPDQTPVLSSSVASATKAVTQFIARKQEGIQGVLRWRD